MVFDGPKVGERDDIIHQPFKSAEICHSFVLQQLNVWSTLHLQVCRVLGMLFGMGHWVVVTWMSRWKLGLMVSK